MIFYAGGPVRSILQATPSMDRAATRALVERLYPSRRLPELPDGSLWVANPPDGTVYAGCFPGLTVVCTGEVALDRPSQLDQRFLIEGNGCTTYLHAMHSVVDWFAYGIWSPTGTLERSLSVSPDHGIMENLGQPLAFEAAYWAGERPVGDDDEEGTYPLPFHPLELAEDALRALFGFNYEGPIHDDDPDLESVVLAGYSTLH
jgi:hypothetical protein